VWLTPGSQIWLCAQPVDMRLGFDGLAGKVGELLAISPFEGHCFIFRNKRGNRLKLLAWDGLGFWLLARRLDQGRFHWPTASGERVELSAGQWALLTEGRAWQALPSLQKCTPSLL